MNEENAQQIGKVYLSGLVFTTECQSVILTQKLKPAEIAGQYGGSVTGYLQQEKISSDWYQLNLWTREFLHLETDHWNPIVVIVKGADQIRFYETRLRPAQLHSIGVMDNWADRTKVFPMHALPHTIMKNLLWIMPLINDPYVVKPVVAYEL